MQGKWDRRTVLRVSVGAAAVGSAGCLGVFGSESDDVDVSGVTFEFSYERVASGGAVTMEHTGDEGVPAGDLTVRTGDGDGAVWSELGSTSERPDEAVTTGSTARIGPRVVNWPGTVGPTESVKVLFTPSENSVTELGRFRPPTPTPSPMPTPSPTPTTTPTAAETPATEVVDDFEDGDLSEWTTAERGASGHASWSVTSDHPMAGRYAATYHGDRKLVIASTTGLDAYPSRGDTVEFDFYKGSAEATGWFGFGVQSDTFERGYRVRVRNGNWANHAETATLVRLDGGRKATLDRIEYEPSSHVGERLRWILDWGEPTIGVRAYDGDGSELLSLSADDSTYDDGGVAIAANASDPGTVYADGIRISGSEK